MRDYEVYEYICLNPFEIRASLKLAVSAELVGACCGLNPFEIRASLKRMEYTVISLESVS